MLSDNIDQVEFWNIQLNFKEKSENQSGSLNDFSSLQCNLVARDFNFDKIFSVPKEVFQKILRFTSSTWIFQSRLPFSFQKLKLNEATEHFETQNVSLTVPFKSDNPIVRVPKKFELSGSLGKFARLGYLGTSGAGSCEVNVTTCSDGEPVRSLALTENILYLKGGRDDIKLCIHILRG